MDDEVEKPLTLLKKRPASENLEASLFPSDPKISYSLQKAQDLCNEIFEEKPTSGSIKLPSLSAITVATTIQK